MSLWDLMLAEAGIQWTSADLKIICLLDDSWLTPLHSKVEGAAGAGAVSLYCAFFFYPEDGEKSSTFGKAACFAVKTSFCSYGPTERESFFFQKLTLNNRFFFLISIIFKFILQDTKSNRQRNNRISPELKKTMRGRKKRDARGAKHAAFCWS